MIGLYIPHPSPMFVDLNLGKCCIFLAHPQNGNKVAHGHRVSNRQDATGKGVLFPWCLLSKHILNLYSFRSSRSWICIIKGPWKAKCSFSFDPKVCAYSWKIWKGMVKEKGKMVSFFKIQVSSIPHYLLILLNDQKESMNVLETVSNLA